MEGKILHVDISRGPKRVHYSYVVSGKTFEGAEPGTNLNYRGAGDPILVHYLPSNPADSTVDVEGANTDSGRMILFSIVWFGMVALLFGAVIAINRQGTPKS